MRKPTLLFLLAVFCFQMSAQTSIQDKIKLDWHGFVNPHFYADSRQVVGGREEMMLFYPKPRQDDSLGSDVNDGWNMNMLSITARLSLGVSGPDVLGAHTRAFLEGDFTGSTNATNNNFRLRHAYIDFDWGEHRVLAGQYWHPMVVPEIMPNTRPLNMGAPFHPYARYSQLRYVATAAHWQTHASLLFQQDNMSQGIMDGAVTSSTQFLRRSATPEMNVMLYYQNGILMAGGGMNMLSIRPRLATSGAWSVTDKRCTSFSYTLFAKIQLDGWAANAQVLLNNAMYEICSMGGYYETVHVNATGVDYEYTPWHFNTAWLDVGRTSGKWRPGVFVGYGRNSSVVGSQNEANDRHMAFDASTQFFGRGADIEYLWRLQPRIGYHASPNFNIYAEVEYTYASYSSKQTWADGTWSWTRNPDGGVGNTRLMLSAEYRW